MEGKSKQEFQQLNKQLNEEREKRMQSEVKSDQLNSKIKQLNFIIQADK